MKLFESPTDGATTLAVAQGYVYWWSLGKKLQRCPTTGCATPEPLTTATDVNSDTVIDGTNVYFGGGTPWTFRTCATTGCADGGNVVGAVPGALGDLAIHDERAFFLGRGPAVGGPGSLGPHLVSRCDLGGCPSVTVLVSQPNTLLGAGLRGLAVGASGLFWMINTSDFSGVMGGLGVFRSPVDGGVPVQLASSGVGALLDIALTRELVVWSGVKGVRSCLASGCTGEPMRVLDEALTSELAVDETRAFVSGSDWVGACVLTGCGTAPEKLATGQSAPSSVCVDDVAVYWTTRSGTAGTIWRLAK